MIMIIKLFKSQNQLIKEAITSVVISLIVCHLIVHQLYLEKSKGVLEGIIGSVYQSTFGKDIYPST